MKKLFILINSFLLLFCLFVPINADDDEKEIINEEPEQKEYIEKSDYDNYNSLKEKVDNLEKEIIEIKENNTKSGNSNNAKKTSYDNLTPYQLNYLIDNLNEIAFYYQYSISNHMVIYVLSSDITNVNLTNYGYYNIDYSKAYTIYSNNAIIENIGSTIRYYPDNTSDDSSVGFYYINLPNNNVYYYLNPYTLNILNNGLGSYTNSVNTEPYLSTGYYYSNQLITLTYDDTYEDFTGWYDTNGNLISNQNPYTFNIDQNTNLVINYYSNPIELDYTNLLYIIIGLLTFILFNDLTKGVLN